MNIAVAKTVFVAQNVTVKAKVANLKYQSKERQLWKVQHGTCSSCRPITFYKTDPLGKFCEQCSNLTVHKDKFTDEIYLNTAQSGTAVNTKDDFQEIHVLSVAPQAPAEYLVTTQDSKLTLTNSQNASDFWKNLLVVSPVCFLKNLSSQTLQVNWTES